MRIPVAGNDPVRGLVLKMVFEDGPTKLLPFYPDEWLEHWPGVEAKLVSSDEFQSTVLYRQLPHASCEVEIGNHMHPCSSETILVTKGALYFKDRKETYYAGESIRIAMEEWHDAVFQRIGGENCEVVIVWRPPLKELRQKHAP